MKEIDRADQRLRPQVEVRRSSVRRQRRFSIANYRTMVASARQRGVRLGEKPAVPRISDLGHLSTSSLGKLELDMMGSHQMSERQVLDAILAEAIGTVFEEYVDKHGLDEIADIFRQGREDRGRRHAAVARRTPSGSSACRRRGRKRSRSTPAESEAVRASCVEFVLAGLYATDRISRSTKHGRIVYEP